MLPPLCGDGPLSERKGQLEELEELGAGRGVGVGSFRFSIEPIMNIQLFEFTCGG